MTLREPISKRLRFNIFKRDQFVCQYCGNHPPDVVLEIDHISPICDGGNNDEENLITACCDCNRGKAGIPLSSIPKSLSARAAEIEEREEQIRCYREIIQSHLDRIEIDQWRVADELFPGSSENGIRHDWLMSIKMFNEKLPLHIVIDSAGMARARKPFSDRTRFLYFCGVCWNKIRSAETQ